MPMPPTKSDKPGDEQADPADDGRHLVNHLQDLLLLVDGEIIRIARRQAPDAAHDAVQFFLGVLQIRDVLDLDLDHLHLARVQESGHAIAAAE